VNEGSKYPITSGDRWAITCRSGWCAAFGTNGLELVIVSDSNNNNTSCWCAADGDSFKLPAAKGSQCPSINGGEQRF
jgi:hypothetical protein